MRAAICSAWLGIRQVSKTQIESTVVRAGLVLVASQVAIGSSGIFARFALHGTGPVMVSALRLTIASLILLVVCLRSERQTVSTRHEMLFAICGFALAAHFATWLASLCYVSVATSTFLVSTAPLWTTLYDVIVLKKKPAMKFWYGLFLAIIGTVLIVTGTADNAASAKALMSSNIPFFGELLALIGGVAFAFYLIAIRSVSKSYKTLTIITRTYSWSAVFLWLAALGFGESVPGANVESWSGILAMALVAQIFGHTCLNAALKTFEPRVVALTTLLEPVVAGVLAAIFFGEMLSGQMIAGAGLLLGALALVLAASPVDDEELEQGTLMPG